MHQMGDTLIYGYERNICFEINDKSYNTLRITNKIDKDCIFKGYNNTSRVKGYA